MFGLALRQIPYASRWVFGTLTFGLMLLFGWGLGERHDQLTHHNHYSHFLHQDNVLVGKITKTPELGKRLKAQLSIQSVQDSVGTWQATSGKLLAYIDGDSSSLALQYGDVVVLRGWVQPVEPPQNPDQFDYQKYLHVQNIHFQTFVKREMWMTVGTNKGNPILKFAYKTRTKAIEQLRKALPTEHEFSVGAALILGYKAEISDEVREAYAGTGAMHVLAVSGLHVGLVYLFLNFFLGFIKSKRRGFKILKPLLMILGVWVFALLTGLAPSVLRAAMMFSFIIIGQALHRYTNIYNTLAASAFLLLCIEPYLMMNVGFQLSYLAVIGIVYLQPRIYKCWIIDHIIGDRIWSLTAVSLAAQLTTLPLSLYYFHQFPIFFWLASLIVVPAATFILGLGLLTLMLSWIPVLGSLVGKVLFGLIWVVNALIFTIQQIPYSLLTGIWITGLTMLLLYAFLLALVFFFRYKKPVWLLAALSLLLFVGMGQAHSSIQQQKQNRIVVYHLYKNSIVDFISGKKATTITSREVDDQQIGFTAENHQQATGVRHKERTYFDEQHKNDYLFAQKELIRFHDKTIFIIRDKVQLKTSLPIQPDYIFVQNSPYLNMADIQKQFQPQQLIFDGSNKQGAVRIWKRQCAEVGLDCYDTGELGAWILEVE